MRQYHFTCSITGLVLLAVCAVQTAQAQRLLVGTAAYAATGEIVGVYSNLVEVGGETGPRSIRLPGDAPLGFHLSQSRDLAAFTTGAPWKRSGGPPPPQPTLITVMSTAAAGEPASIVSVEGWRQWAAGFVYDDVADAPYLIIAGARVDGYGTWRGRLDVRSIRSGPTLHANSYSWPLPGPPVDVLPLSGGNEVVALCETSSREGMALLVLNAFNGRVFAESRTDAGQRDEWALSPSALALSMDFRQVLVSATGYALDSPTGERITLLRLFDLSLTETAKPVEAPGMAVNGGTALSVAPDGRCWLATQSPDGRHGFVTAVEVRDGGLTKSLEVPLSGRGAPLIALAPAGGDVAVATQDVVELWPRGVPGGARRIQLDGPATALAWTSHGLFAGVGNELVALPVADGVTETLSAFQNGRINHITALPETPPATDPVSGNALSGVPRLVLFQDVHQGHAVRKIPVDVGNNRWRVEFEDPVPPWFEVTPREGMGGDVLTLRADSSAVGGASAQFSVIVDLPGDGARAWPVDVRVLPGERAVRRILWLVGKSAASEPLRSAADPHGLKVLADQLASAPDYFAHRTPEGPIFDSLDSHAVIVMTPASAGAGLVTRQALLNFVADGGGLLVVNEGSQEDMETMGRWFESMGAHLAAGSEIQGAYSATGEHPVARFWQNVTIRSGRSFVVDDTEAIVVPTGEGANGAAFSVHRYGEGHVAFLAGWTPLTSDAMARRENRVFSAELFRWLSQPETGLLDSDGDGLDDDIEARNQTEPLKPDSDGDGIPDGQEDRNRNGRVDPGETDPRAVDTDNDGTWDGADISPA